jgi:hypothetical protein
MPHATGSRKEPEPSIRKPSIHTEFSSKRLVPEVGAIKIKKLDAEHVDHWLDGLTDELSAASLPRLHTASAGAAR